MWTLAITPEEFDTIYEGLDVDKTLFERLPKNSKDLLHNFLPSKLWRLNNLYTIVGKRPDKETGAIKIQFRMNRAQHKCYAKILVHPRLIILKSRQQGISTFWLIFFFDDALTLPDLDIGLMSQGLEESATLLHRVKVAWSAFPESIRKQLNCAISRDNDKMLLFKNNAKIFIRTSFRSATLQRLHISELGKIAAENPKRVKETKTGTMQTIAPENILVIESTAEGDNEFKEMWDLAIEAEERYLLCGYYGLKDLQPLFLSWLDDDDCKSTIPEIPTRISNDYFKKLEDEEDAVATLEQKNWWISQYRELAKEIAQEYPATPQEAFAKSREGTYYAEQYRVCVIERSREIVNLYDPNLKVHVVMDLGYDADDEFVLIYCQYFAKEWRVIDEYKNFGRGLEHYVDHMKDTGYDIGRVIGPHDLKVHELDRGYSREERLRELGVKKLTVLPKTSSIATDIEQVRKIIPFLFIDPLTSPYIVSCLKKYSRLFDEKSQTWERKPNHNKWSHGADAFRCMALSGITEKDNMDYRRRKSNPHQADGTAL